MCCFLGNCEQPVEALLFQRRHCARLPAPGRIRQRSPSRQAAPDARSRPTSTAGVFGAAVLLDSARRWDARDRQFGACGETAVGRSAGVPFWAQRPLVSRSPGVKVEQWRTFLRTSPSCRSQRPVWRQTTVHRTVGQSRAGDCAMTTWMGLSRQPPPESPPESGTVPERLKPFQIYLREPRLKVRAR